MPNITQSRLLAFYRMMRLIRRTEEILIEEYHPANEMRCPIHFCAGQGAAPAALSFEPRPRDVVMSHYRSHGYCLAKRAPLGEMVTEFYGKATGSKRGLGGSMGLAHHDHRFYSGAIVVGPLLISVGSGSAHCYQATDAMTVAVFGDGVMDEGVAHEAINLAVLHELPVLFLCENNGYAAHTPTVQRTKAPDFLGRVTGFAIPVKRESSR